jgi:hypothetical protein
MEDEDFRDSEFFESIKEDVLGVLRKNRFFELLDDRFSPVDSSTSPFKCGHSFSISSEILCALGMDSEEIIDVLGVLHSQGACCDCEVLYNVAEESRLRCKYWEARAREHTKSESKPAD